MTRIFVPIFVLTVSLAGITGCAAQGAGPAVGTTAGATPQTSTPAETVLPLDFSRTGGLAGRDERLHIDTDGTLTVTRGGVTGKPVKLDPSVVAALKQVLVEPAPAASSSAVCSDGYRYRLSTPSWTYTADDCSGSQSEFDRTLDLLVPLLQGAVPSPS
jgi:hypothetical protein